MYTTIEYISTTGQIPILPKVPFKYNDGVLLKSEAELTAMDFSSLIRYSSTLSTSISYQTSTLIQNNKISALYGFLKRLSQSTIDGLNKDIAINSGYISVYEGIERELNNENIVWKYDGIEWTEDTGGQTGGGQTGGGGSIYVSTLDQFDATITNQLEYINSINSNISSYTNQYTSSMSSVAQENSTFISSAKGYSTRVWAHIGYQDLYDKKMHTMHMLTDNLKTAKATEERTSTILAESTIRWRNITDKLGILYGKRTNITSNIAVLRMKESDAYLKYHSSIDGLSTVSSLYNSAIINEQYAIALAELTQQITEYSDALALFNAADLSWTAQGGGASGASGASGNSALKAARDMAQQQLDIKRAAKIAAENASSRLLDLATLANTSAYETMLLGYDSRIDAYARTAQKFKSYKNSALQEVVRFSSIYEKAIIDMSNYTQNITRYSTLYESSIHGASTLLGLSDRDLSTIQGESDAYEAISLSIRGLNTEYTRLSGQYDEYMARSTLYASQYYSSLSNVARYRSIYTSTSDTVNKLNMELYGSGGLMSVYYATLFTNSTLLNDDIISQKVYDSEIMDLVNQQDSAMYHYRETYSRYKRVAYQSDYEDKIYAAVELAQANLQPVANLETDEIHTSRANLSNINTFIPLFSNIYNLYTTQASNISQISTSVGYESNAWSSLNSYTWAKYFQTGPVNNTSIDSSCKYLTLQQNTTAGLLQTFASQQSEINTKKLAILSGLEPFFTSAERDEQTNTISSFITASTEDLANMITNYTAADTVLTWTDL